MITWQIDIGLFCVMGDNKMRWIFTCFDSATLVKNKIHPSGDHATSYRQRGWDYICPYLCCCCCSVGIITLGPENRELFSAIGLRRSITAFRSLSWWGAWCDGCCRACWEDRSLCDRSRSMLSEAWRRDARKHNTHL